MTLLTVALMKRGVEAPSMADVPVLEASDLTIPGNLSLPFHEQFSTGQLIFHVFYFDW